MIDTRNPVGPRSPIEDSYLELLAGALESLDMSARGKVLQRYFRAVAHLNLAESQSIQIWHEVLLRRAELTDLLGHQVSLKTALNDVLSAAIWPASGIGLLQPCELAVTVRLDNGAALFSWDDERPDRLIRSTAERLYRPEDANRHKAGFTALRQAQAIETPVSPQIKSRKLLVGLALAIMITAVAAATRKPQTAADNQALFSFPQADPAASMANTKSRGKQTRRSETATSLMPVTTKQAAPNPLRVSYEDNKLTIIAEGVALSELMSAVRAQTGADVQISPETSSERIWAAVGPGPARLVLAQLLDSTNLDYIIRASETDPSSIQSILLLRRDNSDTSMTGRPETSSTTPSD